MARKSITFAPGFETALRRVQAHELKFRDEDYTYNQALHLILFYGFLNYDKSTKGAVFESIEEMTDLLFKKDGGPSYLSGVLDMLPADGTGPTAQI